MSSAVIVLEPERQFQIPSGSGFQLVQGESDAVDVSRYHLIVPFVRVKTTPAATIPPTGITLSFSSAATLDYPDQSQTGERFVDNVASILINSAGGTFTLTTLSTGGLNAIQNPGRLLLWKFSNNTGSTANFVGDIWLVCRGF